jgi:hypothetical protein
MIKVSQNYLDKSLAPGRSVKCRIIAGNNTYTDKDILSFEFNDVVHTEDMSFGTTCANRFRFELWSRLNIPLSAVIRPFVGFAEPDGSGAQSIEECTLGEFYITRRYRRRERYSVVCYDKMYRLDSRYNPSIACPCTTEDLLKDIAQNFNFKVGFVPAEDVVEGVPRTATCREVIGYIAGLNGGFAKFDRNGVLQLKKLTLCDFALMRSQYTELSIKADVNEIRAIEFIGDGETFSEGRGTKVSTYRQHNPFANKGAAERVFDEWNGFEYRGLTVKMRGLPFLESGDAIMVQDDFDNTHYFALISDYTLTYDGGLTGRLISKSKNPIDDYDEPMNMQRMMESLSENLRVTYVNYVNEKDIVIGRTAEAIASINFNLESRTFAVFNSQFTVTPQVNCVLTLSYSINNKSIGQTPQQYLTENSPSNICLYNCFFVMQPGRNTLTVTASVSAGSALIKESELIASVSGQYMLGDGGPQRPEINMTQSFGKYEMNPVHFGIREFTAKLNELEQAAPEKPEKEAEAPVHFGHYQLNPVNFTLSFSARLLMESLVDEVRMISAHRILLVFSNTVLQAEPVINLNAFAVTFGVIELSVVSVEVSDNEMIITIDEDLNNYQEVVVKYDIRYGNLLSAATGNPLQSFNYILNLEDTEETLNV